MMFGLFALASAAIFFGAAFYVNFAEQSARLSLDDRSLLAEWKPAYKRGFIMQASLAVIGFVLGILAWWQTGVTALDRICVPQPQAPRRLQEWGSSNWPSR